MLINFSFSLFIFITFEITSIIHIYFRIPSNINMKLYLQVEVVKKQNCLLIKWSDFQTIDTWNSYLGDNLHLNNVGMEQLSIVVSTYIKTFFVEGIEVK